MNHKYLDTLWFQAQHEAIEAGEPFTRYRFAALVAAAERKACAQIVEWEAECYGEPVWAVEIIAEFRAREQK